MNLKICKYPQRLHHNQSNRHMQQLPEFLVSFVFQNLFEYSLYFPKCLVFSLHFTLSFNSMFSFVMCFYLKFFFIPSFDISLLVTNSLFLSENILIPLSYLCNILGVREFKTDSYFFSELWSYHYILMTSNNFCWAANWGLFATLKLEDLLFSEIF